MDKKEKHNGVTLLIKDWGSATATGVSWELSGFGLSIRRPSSYYMSIEDATNAAKRVAKKLGLTIKRTKIV